MYWISRETRIKRHFYVALFLVVGDTVKMEKSVLVVIN